MRERAADPSNRQQSHWVLIGADAWETAAGWRDNPRRVFAACPPGADPASFDWSLYRSSPPPVGLVRCGRVDGGQLHKLVQAMLAAGAPRIFDILADAVYQPARCAA